ncbi:HepT-like ribonuclease domain-containing protein [Prauserella flavalba]|nr:HepT-like ribonuclease domain-containing protein [Prauserella flavalba]
MMLIGEIAGAVSPELRDRYPDVPWRRMRGFRNIAVHQYFAIDWAVVWRIATEDVPKLEAQAMSILRGEFPDIAARYEERPDAPTS